MRTAFVLGVTALLLWPGLVRAEMSEEDQKQACMGDAFKLCASDIPDREAVRRCMATKREQLSPKCATAFEGGPTRRKSR